MRCGAAVPWVALAVAVAAPRAGGSGVNVVHYLVDDLSPDLVGVHRDAAGARGSGYGSGWETPRLAAMAKAGVAFRTAWAPAMCTPSRVSLLTGRYPSETGVYHNNLVVAGRGCRDAATWPALLRAAGFATGITGKWGAKGTLAHLESPEAAGFDASHVWLSHVRTAKLDRSPCDVTEGRDAASLGKVPSRYWHACYGNESAYAVEDFGPDGEWAFAERFMASTTVRQIWRTVALSGLIGVAGVAGSDGTRARSASWPTRGRRMLRAGRSLGDRPSRMRSSTVGSPVWEGGPEPSPLVSIFRGDANMRVTARHRRFTQTIAQKRSTKPTLLPPCQPLRTVAHGTKPATSFIRASNCH